MRPGASSSESAPSKGQSATSSAPRSAGIKTSLQPAIAAFPTCWGPSVQKSGAAARRVGRRGPEPLHELALRRTAGPHRVEGPQERDLLRALRDLETGPAEEGQQRAALADPRRAAVGERETAP